MERKLIGVVRTTMFCETANGKVWQAEFLPRGAPDSEDMRKAAWTLSSMAQYRAQMDGVA